MSHKGEGKVPAIAAKVVDAMIGELGRQEKGS